MSEQEWMNIFGDNLAKMISKAGYSQEEFAKEAGLSQSTVSKYINKQQLPGIKAIVKIAYVLDCDVTELADFEDIIE